MSLFDSWNHGVMW